MYNFHEEEYLFWDASSNVHDQAPWQVIFELIPASLNTDAPVHRL